MDDSRFENLGVVRSGLEVNDQYLDLFISEINRMKKKGSWSKEELVDRQGKTREVTLVTIWSAEGGPRKARPSAMSTRSANSARSKARRSKKKVKKRLDRFRETKWLALRPRLKIVFT